MSIDRRSLLAALALAAPLAAAGCSTKGDGGGSGGDGGSGGSSATTTTSATGAGGGASGLAWYATCGDPVCGGHQDQPGIPACTTEVLGAPCDAAGATCDPRNDCNSLVTCAVSDPAINCPISRAVHKEGITYLNDADMARVHDELMTMRLARWRGGDPLWVQLDRVAVIRA